MADRRALSARAAVLAMAATLTLAGCTTTGEKPAAQSSPSGSPSPSSTVSVPPSVKLTEVGARLAFGQTATVIYEPDQKTGTVLELAVEGARQGSTADFKGYILNDYTRAATPYYVDVRVRNVGDGTVGPTAVPLWGVDAQNTLLPPATFTTRFATCPSEELPARFAPGDTLRTCLVYLAPERGRLTAVSFRPNQQFEPIQWTGAVATPSPKAGG